MAGGKGGVEMSDFIAESMQILNSFKGEEQKEKETTAFFKEAFCVDGNVSIVSCYGLKIAQAVELNDSIRGRFYVGLLILE